MKYSFHITILAFTALTTFVSCKSDKPDASKEASPAAMRAAQKIENSTLVSNPVTADQPVKLDKVPKFQFDGLEHDFGVVKEGDIVFHEFAFKNIGEGPLVISDARGSCGCTVPEYPREPIAAGASGVIKVKFNSAGKHGSQEKTVTLTANTYPNTQTVLKIRSNVKEGDEKPKQ